MTVAQRKRLDRLEAKTASDKGSLMAGYLCRHWMGKVKTTAQQKFWNDVQAGKETFEMSDFSPDFREWIEK